MGIQSGSISLCRFKVLGHTKGLGIKTLSERLEPFILHKIDLKSTPKEEVMGWVRPQGIDKLDLPPEAHWDMSHAALEDGFLPRMRIEKRKVPASLLAAILRQRLAEEQQRSEKKLTRQDKGALKEAVHKDLMARALPVLSFVDAYWKHASGDLMLFSNGKSVRGQFETLFMATFGKPLDLSLLPIDPPLLGMGAKPWQDTDEASDFVGRLAMAVPVSFAEAAYP